MKITKRNQIEAQYSDAREACDDPSFANGSEMKKDEVRTHG